MKSSKQRRLEIKEKRRKKAAKLKISTFEVCDPLPKGAVLSSSMELRHNNIYCVLPLFYVDKAYSCQDCGSKELWTAKQQKWWYEIAKGNIYSSAVKCLKCRKKIKPEKETQKNTWKKWHLKNPIQMRLFLRNVNYFRKKSR